MKEAPSPTGLAVARLAPAFQRRRLQIDARVLKAFQSGKAHRLLHGAERTDLAALWPIVAEAFEPRETGRGLTPLEVHRQLLAGLPGEAMFIASAMTFASMAEALPFFGLSAKTARARLGERLSPSEGELALRVGRASALARDVLGDADAAREYLATPNVALGGARPRDLLRTAEGEQIVLAELQAQADGGPV